MLVSLRILRNFDIINRLISLASMTFFPCCSSNDNTTTCFSSNGKKAQKKSNSGRHQTPTSSTNDKQSATTIIPPYPPTAVNVKPPKKTHDRSKQNDAIGNNIIAAQTFTFRELATATKNFQQEFLLAEVGFGKVYKGCLENNNNGGQRLAAIKKIERNGLQGNKEFLAEVSMLSRLNHPNLVSLIGYCADGEERLLVYEFMAMGPLENHLLDIEPEQTPLCWFTRMKIATGAAKGLEYLHHKVNPPVIYRDLKSSNILLDEEFNPKLCDFGGLAKLGPVGDNEYVPSSWVMGTYGYRAPESEREVTLKSDIYSFGVILLELITGRRAIDTTRPTDEEILVSWAQSIFKDQKRYSELADPHLHGDYPVRGFNQAVVVAATCLQEEASARPLISDVVVALSLLLSRNGSSFSISDEQEPKFG